MLVGKASPTSNTQVKMSVHHATLSVRKNDLPVTLTKQIGQFSASTTLFQVLGFLCATSPTHDASHSILCFLVLRWAG